MPKAAFDDLLQFLRKVSAVHGARHQSDAELLQRFQANGDNVALSILVQRHGPMVLAVSRRVLGDFHSAEDVFQATFLVLVRRARTLKCSASLGTWLYAVARRIAIKARAKAAARQCRERELDDMAQREQLDEVTWNDLRAVLDEEIGRLPEKYSASCSLLLPEQELRPGRQGTWLVEKLFGQAADAGARFAAPTTGEARYHSVGCRIGDGAW